MKAKLVGLTLFSLTAATVAFYPSAQGTTTVTPPTTGITVAPIANETPKVELVFVLDTTSSMSGFIDAAKEKIWSIASTMASAQPAPELQIGLVAFRDRGDAYVTRVTDLSTDLDSMYATLLDYRAEGGGDGPESVNQALYDAVHDISWSQDPNSYKVIFLVGDAPPHMDYQDDVPYADTIKVASARGIVINTIQSGAHDVTRLQWQQIASLSQGEYFEVGESGGALAIATPYDKELATLSAELDDTRLFYGSAEELESKKHKVEAAEKLNILASVQALARRAKYNTTTKAGETNLLMDGDLVSDVKAGRVDLADVPRAELPEPLRDLSEDEVQVLVDNSVQKRDELRARIQQLSEQRDSYVMEQVAETEGVEESFDHQLYRAIGEQSPSKGLVLPEAPSY